MDSKAMWRMDVGFYVEITFRPLQNSSYRIHVHSVIRNINSGSHEESGLWLANFALDCHSFNPSWPWEGFVGPVQFCLHHLGLRPYFSQVAWLWLWSHAHGSFRPGGAQNMDWKRRDLQ